MKVINSIFFTAFNYIGESYLAIFILMALEATSLPIILPAEFILISAGYFVYQQKMNFLAVVAISTIGTVFGSIINYYLAFWLGQTFIYKYGKYIFLPIERLQKLQKAFTKYDSVIVFSGRLMPFIKHLVAIPAGLMQMSISRFTGWTAAGGLLFSLIMVSAGMVIGRNKQHINEVKTLIAITLTSFSAILIVGYYFYDKYWLSHFPEKQKCVKDPIALSSATPQTFKKLPPPPHS